jgi:hypothetical protein
LAVSQARSDAANTENRGTLSGALAGNRRRVVGNGGLLLAIPRGVFITTFSKPLALIGMPHLPRRGRLPADES